MSVVRTQYVIPTAATIPAGGAATAVDVLRPFTSPAQVPYAENTDYVTRPRHLLDNEGGMVVIDLGTVFTALGTLFLRAVEVWQGYPAAQTGLFGAMFPSGSPAPASPSFARAVFSVPGNTLPCTSALIPGIIGGSIVDPKFPGISLKSGEFVRLTFVNTAGAATGEIEAKYDLGVNTVEYRKL